MNVYNLTGRPLTFVSSSNHEALFTLAPHGRIPLGAPLGGQVLSIPPTGHWVPLLNRRRPTLVDLPAPSTDSLFIVSEEIAWAANDRDDLAYPAGPIYQNGYLVGYVSLVRPSFQQPKIGGA